jgi:hypothetical protein
MKNLWLRQITKKSSQRKNSKNLQLSKKVRLKSHQKIFTAFLIEKSKNNQHLLKEAGILAAPLRAKILKKRT